MTSENSFDWDNVLSESWDKVSEANSDSPPPTPAEEKESISSDPPADASDSNQSVDQEITEIPDQGSDAVVKPVETQPLSPPDRWSADRKAKFSALPREAQEILLERESEIDKAFTQKSQDIAEKERRYGSLEQVLAPRRQAFAMSGMNEVQAVEQLFALYDNAVSDPVGFVKRFAADHRLNLNELDSEPLEQPHPQINQFQQQLASIQNEISSYKRQAVDNEISAFANTKNEKGDLVYPHFSEVSREMAALLRSEVSLTLAQAYEKAVRVNDAVWGKIQESKQQEQEAKRIEAAKIAAAKAQKAVGVTLKPKANIPAGASKSKNWEEDLERIFDEVSGES